VTPAFLKAIDTTAVAIGGMIAVTLEGHELVICNSNGSWYAVERRCGHMNAPLDKGTLDGAIVTCPMHCAQFDVRTGGVLCGPMPHDPGAQPPTLRGAQLRHDLLEMIEQTRTLPIRTFETKLEAGAVWVRLPSA
jgi:nitrite reductase/ring-hydroxylating ferredoxin subunit